MNKEILKKLVNDKLNDINTYNSLLNKAIKDQNIEKIKHYSKVIYETSTIIEEYELMLSFCEITE